MPGCPTPARQGFRLAAAAALAVLPAAAAAQTTAAGDAGILPEQLVAFAKSYQFLFGGALGAGIGYLLKWMFDQWSAARAARRQFARSVTNQISELAKSYYWSLANHAGALAGLLEMYLENRAHHLMLVWHDRKELSRRLDEIAEEHAKMSFYHFCRLIGLFDEFQFRGSNTYLLTSHAAGETCKRLYNAFIQNLPRGDSQDGIDTLKIARILRERRPSRMSDKDVPVFEFPSELFMEQIVRDELDDELKAYTRWMRSRELNVEEAADALRAYNELLNHELARLYRDFFDKSPPSPDRYLSDVAFGDWPNLLSEQSYLAMERASAQSVLLRPLGAPLAAGDSGSKEDRLKSSDHDDERRQHGEGERQEEKVERRRRSEDVSAKEGEGEGLEAGKLRLNPKDDPGGRLPSAGGA